MEEKAVSIKDLKQQIVELESKVQAQAPVLLSQDRKIRTLELDNVKYASAFSLLSRQVLSARQLVVDEMKRILVQHTKAGTISPSACTELSAEIDNWAKEHASEV